MRTKGVKGFIKKLYKYRSYLLMLMPAVVYTLIFSYYPMAGVILAFKKYTYAGGIWGSEWNGLENFKFFFMSGQAGLVTRNTVLYNILFIVVGTVVQIAVAIFLTEIRSKSFRKLSQSFMFLPYFISWVIVGVMAFNIFSSDYGFLNNLITALGGEKISFYSKPEVWPAILLFFNVWKGVGYGSILYLAAIMGIDTSVYESAAIDGANVIQRIHYVTIPMLSGTTFFIIVTSIINSFKVFGLINLMTNGGPGSSTTMLVYNIYRTGFQFGKLEFASAQGIVLLIIIFIITWLQFRIQRRNEAAM